MIGRQTDRAAEAGDRLVALPRYPVKLAQIAVILRDGGVDGNRSADQLDRHAGLAVEMSQDAQHVQRVGLVGALGHDLATDLLRRVPAPAW